VVIRLPDVTVAAVALVVVFLTAGIALALLRPRAEHVDGGWE
jgi:hypothetical protein